MRKVQSGPQTCIDQRAEKCGMWSAAVAEDNMLRRSCCFMRRGFSSVILEHVLAKTLVVGAGAGRTKNRK